MTSASPPPLVSIVLETDSFHPSDTLTPADCLAALARQDYPSERIELIVVNGGKVPGLALRTWPGSRA